jgi:hypothetical protein
VYVVCPAFIPQVSNIAPNANDGQPILIFVGLLPVNHAIR